jgi:hypothetical protein
VGLWNKGKPKSDQWKKTASAAMKGKHKDKKWCNKDGVNKRVSLEKYETLLTEGWVPGRSLSETAIEKMRDNGLAQVHNTRK